MLSPLPNQIVVDAQFDLAEGWLDDVCASNADRVIGDEDWLALAIRCGLAQALPADAIGQVSLLLTDDATVRELNRQYRGLDETTDVLSFSTQHPGEWQGDDTAPSPLAAEGQTASPSPSMGEGWGEGEELFDFPIPDGEPPPLGDIVISIPQTGSMGEGWGEGEELFDFPIPDGEPPPLGDIVISIPQAARQAGEQGVPLHREVALLLVHGALHLLGHDHLDVAPRADMQALEQAALARIFEGN